MPDQWDSYIDKHGGVLQARKIAGATTLTRILDGGSAERQKGQPGDYVVKRPDGYLEIIPKKRFSERYKPWAEMLETPGVLKANAVGVGSRTGTQGEGGE